MRQKKNLYKLLAEQNKKKKKYFENYLLWGRKVKKIAEHFLPKTRVLIFGSVIKGEYGPDSDIDFLIISPNVKKNLFDQAAIKAKIYKEFLDAPFEIHLITPNEYNNWYKNFIKKDFLEIRD